MGVTFGAVVAAGDHELEEGVDASDHVLGVIFDLVGEVVDGGIELSGATLLQVDKHELELGGRGRVVGEKERHDKVLDQVEQRVGCELVLAL